MAMLGKQEITAISIVGEEGQHTIYSTTVTGNLLCHDVRMYNHPIPPPTPLLIPSPTYSLHTGLPSGEELNAVSIGVGKVHCGGGSTNRWDFCAWTGDDLGRVVRWDRYAPNGGGSIAGVGGGRGSTHNDNALVTCVGVRRPRGKKVRGGQVVSGGTDCKVVLWEDRGGEGGWEGVDEINMGKVGGEGQFANPPFVNALSWCGDDVAVGLGDGGVAILGYRGGNKRKKVKAGLFRKGRFEGGHGGGVGAVAWGVGWGGEEEGKGRWVLSGGNEGNICIWDVNAGAMRDGVRKGGKGPNGVCGLSGRGGTGGGGKVVEVGEGGVKIWDFGWKEG
ncbi:hypothetical protein TrCOL_g12938 [Triparma columacea]|uniref:Uncharacterized protein n=1 Tax=Triparma columacea TaxID=722753 RepID=A0A9W7GCZ3_9STRA|nr:hypothetical protein TrCOL_g12938 [Triparma columacea]